MNAPQPYNSHQPLIPEPLSAYLNSILPCEQRQPWAEYRSPIASTVVEVCRTTRQAPTLVASRLSATLVAPLS